MFLALCCFVSLSQAPIFEVDQEKLGIPYDRFTTKDAHGRTITAYLSKPPAESQGAKLPVILVIQGSGSQSIWVKRGDRVGGGLQNLVLMAAKNRARILAVEKPGVKYLDWPKQPGTATEGSKEFLAEHTLPRWAEANAAALKAVLAQEDIDTSSVLVMGHSEGGIVAARVAAELSAVTHVAPLACGGLTQLFSLATLARKRAPKGEENAAVEKVYADWEKILAKPDSTEDFWMSHPYRRWSTFLKDSVLAELLRTKAQIYLTHGSADEADAVEGFDAMRAELLARGRKFSAERIEGGSHGFSTSGPKGDGEGMKKVFGNVIEWYLQAQPKK